MSEELKKEVKMEKDKLVVTPLELLVVEDSPSHLADVKAEIQRRIDAGIKIKVDYASTLDEAMTLVAEKKYDGIVSDVFFPGLSGGEEESSGISMCEYAKKEDIPIVLCTSTYHHGKRTQPVHDYCMKHRVSMVDTFDGGDIDAEAETKQWYDACYLLILKVMEKKLGEMPTAEMDESVIESYNQKKKEMTASYILMSDFDGKERYTPQSYLKEGQVEMSQVERELLDFCEEFAYTKTDEDESFPFL